MKKVMLLVALVLGGLVFAQAQPLVPHIPFTPLLSTTIKETQVLGPYGSVWKIFWDGWEGTLVLQKGGVGYIETGGKKYNLEYVILKNPQDNVLGMAGPDYTGKNTNIGHRIVFIVDFANTPNNRNDDQRFDGYIFTQTINTPSKRAIAGITCWDQIPFGFYATYWYDIPG
ncbi:hypothetical protein AS159_05600 [Thermotoga sp. Ku-13t]|uniref:hypothetical protein n=1 Tax=Thermotoga sp. Ku-13t TaxID=1755813 RepID=UPI0013EAA2CC|nr:hypothetical protein [Thermotoga sp. Ku-13t]KAF2957871.1 hypothetical protein AS159_05600 [Thermotoga sp. Ku-13t]